MTIAQAVNAYGARLNTVFDYDRSKTVGASEIGLCGRRVAFLKQRYPTDAAVATESGGRPAGRRPRPKNTQNRRGSLQLEENWGAHVRGNVIEQTLWVPAMRARYGQDFVRAGEDQKVIKKGNLSATPDGLVLRRGHEILRDMGVKFSARTSRDVVVECKSIDPRVNLVEAKSENAYQVQVQMGLIRELTPYRPDYAVISYIDASFWHEVDEFAVPFEQSAYDAAQMRAGKILRARPEDMRPEGHIAGGKECGYCPFARRCMEMRGGPPAREVLPTEVDPQLLAEIRDMCVEAATLAEKMKSDADSYRGMQEAIRERLKEKGIRKIDGVVNWFGVKGRDTYDVPAMLEALKKRRVDTAQFLTTGDATSSLLINRKILRGVEPAAPVAARRR